MLGKSRRAVGRSFGTLRVALGACSVGASLFAAFPSHVLAADTVLPGTAPAKAAPAPSASSSASSPAPAKPVTATPASAATGVDQRVMRSDGAYANLHVFRPQVACNGVVVVSPGAGDDRDAMSWLGRALSQYGWLTVTMAHQESGRDSLRDRVRNGGLRDGLLALTTDPEAYDDRLEDAGAALRWARGQCHAGPAVLAGHSMGAVTVMIEAGAKNKLGLDSDDRFDAYIALSPQGKGAIFPAGAWHDVRKPALLVTGTRDDPLEGKWQTRTEPFADMPPGCHWLAVVDGATHFNFAGFGYGHGDIEAKILPLMERFLDNVRGHRCAVPTPAAGVKFDTK
ncbi:alpha/beta hydrolase [Pandoraea anapnoica]|uniref:Alpha/beta hydrolase n=1 Tax=Pandoraea anapnoica TaxID=2508301 RepID=A0A5E4ZUK9_9BURK|nr:alpha/beta hydrolase [Pandoraea anapnoica]